MNSFIIYCPHLNRDVRGILNSVPNPHIWTGWETEHGEDGCIECHHAIVRFAKERSLPCVLVLEDDCQFTKHFQYERWLEVALKAYQKGYDVLVGGCTRTWDEAVVEEGLLEVSSFCSAHCIFYFASSYDKVLQTVQPHDVSIGRVGCRIALTWPFVAVQKASYSGILRTPVNYEPLYAAHEARLGHAFGFLEPHVPMPAVY